MLEWRVTGDYGEIREFTEIVTHQHEDGVVSAIEYTADRDDDSVVVSCYVSNAAGTSQDQIVAQRVGKIS